MSSQADSHASLFPTLVNGGGQSDERYLWPEMLRVINEVRPTWVIGENVAGITTMVESCQVTDMGSEATLFEASGGIHRYTAEFAFTIERICSDLESKGYSVQPMLIPACAVGAPHRRDRVFFIAHNNFASDSIHQGSLRNASTNATKEGKERISERNEVQWPNEPADARSEMQSPYADSSCKGLERSHESGSGEGRKRMQVRRNIAGCDCADGSESYSYSYCNRLLESLRARQDGNEGWSGQEFVASLFADSIGVLHPSERWRSFPTVSPIHRGNDGIPFDVDSLTISFSKWRTESIKAYGNAIVPQVMYRIFEAVEAIEKDRTL